MLLEVIATNLNDAINIEKYGGDRIELAVNMEEGGLTPPIELTREVCEAVEIPVYVMVRPHGKSFIYDEEDKKTILNDIKQIAKTKAKGIVFGALTDELTIDEELLKEVIKAKGDLKLTFHRAFDRSRGIFEAFEVLKNYDVERILTSGGRDRAAEAIQNLLRLKDLADLHNIKILVGSGVNVNNVKLFLDFDEVHIGSGVKFDYNNDNDISPKLMEQVLKIIK